MRNTTIKARLAIGYAVLLLLIVIVGVVGITELGTINDKLNEITSINDVEKDMALRLRINVDLQAIAIRDVVLAINDEGRHKASDRLNQLRSQFTERHEKLLKMFQDYEGQPQEFEQMTKMRTEKRGSQAVLRQHSRTRAGRQSRGGHYQGLGNSEPLERTAGGDRGSGKNRG